MANQYRSVLASSGPAPTGGDALPAEVLSGKTFTNDNGAQTGTMTNNGAVSQTLSAGQSYTIPEGYHNGSGIVTASNSSISVVQSANTSGSGTENLNNLNGKYCVAAAAGRITGASGMTAIANDSYDINLYLINSDTASLTHSDTIGYIIFDIV